MATPPDLQAPPRRSREFAYRESQRASFDIRTRDTRGRDGDLPDSHACRRTRRKTSAARARPREAAARERRDTRTRRNPDHHRRGRQYASVQVGLCALTFLVDEMTGREAIEAV